MEKGGARGNGPGLGLSNFYLVIMNKWTNDGMDYFANRAILSDEVPFAAKQKKY